MKKIQFRNYLAEHGIETTPEHAAKIYDIAFKILKNVNKMSMMDVWTLEEELEAEELQLFQQIRLQALQMGGELC
jgi:hypothetical protein